MLAVAGGKGGVGKTTVAVGLARAFARAGRDPLVVDADRDMPDLARRAGVPDAPGVAAVADGTPVPAAAHAADGTGVRVLPLAAGTDGDAVRRTLARARTRDHPVLVDCPAGAGRDAARPLRAADRVLVVTTPTPSSLRDAAKTAAMARALDTGVAGAVVTRAGGPGGNPGSDPPPVERLLGCPPVAAVPETDAPIAGSRARNAYTACRDALAGVAEPVRPGPDAGDGGDHRPGPCRQ